MKRGTGAARKLLEYVGNLMKRKINDERVAKKLLKYIGNPELDLTRDQYHHRLRIYKRNGDPINDQLLCVCDLLDGRILIACYDDNSVKTVSQFLEKNGIVYDILTGAPTHFYLYPNAKRELLEI